MSDQLQSPFTLPAPPPTRPNPDPTTLHPSPSSGPTPTPTSISTLPPRKKVLIIGSGIFGLSTGIEMLLRSQAREAAASSGFTGSRGGGTIGGEIGKQVGERYEVVIVDKCDVVPAPDAASTDISKGIRTGDYADPVIAALNVQATREWRKPEWEGTFHESGGINFVSLPKSDEPSLWTETAPSETQVGRSSSYMRGKFEIMQAQGVNVEYLATGGQVRERLLHLLATKGISGITSSSGVAADGDDGKHGTSSVAEFEGCEGYMNHEAGWAEAERAVRVAIKRFRALGGQILTGMEVVGLIEESVEIGKKLAADTSKDSDDATRVTGVKFASGTSLHADLVVVAAGAWTPSLFAQEGMGGIDGLVASGQCTGFIQLTKDEAEEYRDMPMLTDLNTVAYAFPPNEAGIFKIAIHGAGILNLTNPIDPKSSNEAISQDKGVSVPRTALTPGAKGEAVTKQMVKDLRACLWKMYPKLAREKEFCSTRLCWYTDTVDGSWLIDWHPSKRNVMLATGGSGHAFKLFPVLGPEILNRIEGTLAPELAERWRYGRTSGVTSTSADQRGRAREYLKLDALATRADLQPFRV